MQLDPQLSKLELTQSVKREECENRAMVTYPKAPVSTTALMAAAVVLGRTHGQFYAASLLEDYDIDKGVIRELLGGLTTDADRQLGDGGKYLGLYEDGRLA